MTLSVHLLAMIKSESIKELALALSLAQKAMGFATKDSTNPFFKSSYADLASCIEAARIPLSDNGLSISQMPDQTPEGPALVTILMHKSGEYLQATYPLKPIKDDPQGMGSAITYARRYCFASIIGLASADDDGNAATGQGIVSIPRVSKIQVEQIRSMLKTLGKTDERILISFSVGHLEDLTVDQYQKIVFELEKQIKTKTLETVKK